MIAAHGTVRAVAADPDDGRILECAVDGKKIHENRDRLVDAVVLPAFEEDHEAAHLTN